MTKKIISVLLCVLTILSVFTIVPATSAGAASYKENIINEIVATDKYWYDKSYFSKKVITAMVQLNLLILTLMVSWSLL